MAKINGKTIGMSLVVGTTILLVLAGLLVLVNTSGAAEDVRQATTVEGNAVSRTGVGEAVSMKGGAVNCDFHAWVGKTAAEAETKAKATGRPYRILPPGSAMTMDYRADRINVETDGPGKAAKVKKVSCG